MAWYPSYRGNDNEWVRAHSQGLMPLGLLPRRQRVDCACGVTWIDYWSSRTLRHGDTVQVATVVSVTLPLLSTIAATNLTISLK